MHCVCQHGSDLWLAQPIARNLQVPAKLSRARNVGGQVSDVSTAVACTSVMNRASMNREKPETAVWAMCVCTSCPVGGLYVGVPPTGLLLVHLQESNCQCNGAWHPDLVPCSYVCVETAIAVFACWHRHCRCVVGSIVCHSVFCSGQGHKPSLLGAVGALLVSACASCDCSTPHNAAV